MVKVRIPTPLRTLTGGKSEVETPASDIQSLIESLNGRFPGLKDRVCDDKGEIRRFVNIYLNEEDIRFLKGKHTPLKDGDEVSILPDVGGKGQKKLAAGRVLVIGAGGLGSPAALYLAAAGVGTIGLVDGDVVDLSNLQRQILHTTATVGKPKVDSGRKMLAAINPDIAIKTYQINITAENALSILSDYDLVLDGSDTFTTRYLVNDACFFAKKPLISGSIFRFEGQLTTLKPHEGFPCYRCLYAEPPPAGLVPNCQEAGVLGVLAGTIGVLQAAEAIKEIVGFGTSLAGSMLIYDALEMSFRRTRIPKDPTCPLCGPNPRIKDLSGDYTVSCTI